MHKLLSYTLFSLCPQGGEYWRSAWEEHRVFIQHSYTLKFLLCLKTFLFNLKLWTLEPQPSPQGTCILMGWKDGLWDKGLGGGESGWVAGWVGGLREEWGGWGIKSGLLRGIEVMRGRRSWGPAREGQGRHLSGSGIARQSSWRAIPECWGRLQALPASQKAVTDTCWCPVVNIGIVKSFKCLMSVFLDRSLH